MKPLLHRVLGKRNGGGNFADGSTLQIARGEQLAVFAADERQFPPQQRQLLAPNQRLRRRLAAVGLLGDVGRRPPAAFAVRPRGVAVMRDFPDVGGKVFRLPAAAQSRKDLQGDVLRQVLGLDAVGRLFQAKGIQLGQQLLGQACNVGAFHSADASFLFRTGSADKRRLVTKNLSGCPRPARRCTEIPARRRPATRPTRCPCCESRR